MNIRDLTIDELKVLMQNSGEEAYRAKQVFEWLHKHMISDLSEASNISKNLISKLSKVCSLSVATIEKEYISKIDDTRKYLIRLSDGLFIESVLMKYKYGYSVCISSEVGCNMGCKFCASAIGGFKRNLEPYEMLMQIYLISRQTGVRVSNVVIMGIGEPLKNFDNVVKFLKLINDENGQNISLRNITISTCGIVENIYKLAELNLPITLALSLHAPSQAIREKIMPIAKKYKLHDVMTAMADYFIKTNKRITFEYSLIKDVNSSKKDAGDLIKLFETAFKNRHIDYNVNLIAINEVKECNFAAPSNDEVKAFKDTLEKAGISTLVRRKLGKDISGSCGQLRMSAV